MHYFYILLISSGRGWEDLPQLEKLESRIESPIDSAVRHRSVIFGVFHCLCHTELQNASYYPCAPSKEQFQQVNKMPAVWNSGDSHPEESKPSLLDLLQHREWWINRIQIARKLSKKSFHRALGLCLKHQDWALSVKGLERLHGQGEKKSRSY